MIIKTTRRYHFIPTHLIKFKDISMIYCKNLKQQKFLHCCGSINWCNHLGNNRVLSFKFNDGYHLTHTGAYPSKLLQMCSKGLFKNACSSLVLKRKKNGNDSNVHWQEWMKNHWCMFKWWNISQIFKRLDFSYTRQPGWNRKTILLSEKMS